MRVAPIRDALRRGEVDPGGQWLELGSGTGVGFWAVFNRQS